jgi:hypothetical protein
MAVRGWMLALPACASRCWPVRGLEADRRPVERLDVDFPPEHAFDCTQAVAFFARHER